MELSIKNWIASPKQNKIGTVLFGLATVLALVFVIMWCAALSKVKDGDALASVTFSLIMTFIEYALLLTFVLLGSGLATTLTQMLGVITLITSLISVIYIVVVFSVVKSVTGFDIWGPMSEAFSRAMDEAPMIKTVLALYITMIVLTIVSAFFLKAPEGRKSRLAALLFVLFGGFIGAHDLYVGRKGRAIVKIVLSTLLITSIVTAVICLIDFIMICCGKYKDSEKNAVTEWIVK